MSKDQVAEVIGEERLAEKTNGLFGLLLAIGAKYGLPSICCIWLFMVIHNKDLIIYGMAKDVTAALVEKNVRDREVVEALRELSNSIREPR
jgi:hypothetical protein